MLTQRMNPAISQDAPSVSATPSPHLLSCGPLRALVRWRGFPVVFQALVLAVFVTLALIGWGHFTPAGVNAKLYAKTNIVNLAIWGLWWPAIIWVTFLLGRLWCVVCPLELVSSKAEKLGAMLGLKQRTFGGWLAKGGIALILFAALQMLVPGIQIHRVPHYTSLFLWGSLALAISIGLFFKHRAFCRGFCPVSLLLSAYGRGGMMAVRRTRSDEGERCALPIQPSNDSTIQRNQATCPSLLNPAGLSTNKDCLLCCDCVKADSSGQMQLGFRQPFTKADTREPMASWPLTLFVMIVSGFVTYELCGVWKAADHVFAFVPELIAKALNASSVAGWIKGVWTIAIVPMVIWLSLGLVARVLGAVRTLAECWRRLALPMAVVVATGHMAKGLEKFTSWAGYLPYAWTEPSGVTTAQQMSAKILAQPAAWLSLSQLSVAATMLILLGTGLAWREARLAGGKSISRFVPILLLGSFYLALVIGWFPR